VDQRQLLFAARLVAEHLGFPLRSAHRLKQGRCGPLDQMVLLQPVGDEVADRADLQPVRRAKSIRSSSRAIDPSSRMISQITPLGFSPASRATSTAASV
jgi:hypothetical protein